MDSFCYSSLILSLFDHPSVKFNVGLTVTSLLISGETIAISDSLDLAWEMIRPAAIELCLVMFKAFIMAISGYL